MMITNFVIWNVKPQLIDFETFQIRYYSLLFVVAFITGYIILGKMFRKEGLPASLLDRLTIYVVISTIIGARLGHCLFYEFDYYIQHPLEMILPWRGKIGVDFQFTGYQGLASHGAAIGILIGIYLFSRKSKKPYLWTLDKLAIMVALAGVFIRVGNLMNSEIYGKPSDSNSGFVFVRDFTDLLLRTEDDRIKHIKYYDDVKDTVSTDSIVPIKLDIEFSGKVKSEDYIRSFADIVLRDALIRIKYQNNVVHPDIDNLKYEIEKKHRKFHLIAAIYGVPRYPSQIYEAGAYFFIFLLLMFLYQNRKLKFKDGFISGMFMCTIFIARFIIEFIKADQVEFEGSLPINMGQILSIPFIILGIIFIIIKRPGKSEI
jgi:phosphatidylglycerol:prolipoprotein diacylglycerol transferase